MVGLDAKGGNVAVNGWSKLTGHDVGDLAKRFEGYGVEAIIYTDIGRDGMLSGVNIEATVELARPLRTPASPAAVSLIWMMCVRCARSSRKASPGRSPDARSTKARLISGRHRHWRTSCHSDSDRHAS